MRAGLLSQGWEATESLGGPLPELDAARRRSSTSPASPTSTQPSISALSWAYAVPKKTFD
jgi:hypothetical protein